MFKENLKTLRIMKNLSQKQLADDLKISYKTISHWENGYSEPSIEFIKILKNYFNVTYEELLD